MPNIRKYKSEVISVANPIEGIITAEFRSLGQKYKFLPGQFLHLTLEDYDPSSQWPESRCFSMQSPPSAENIKLTFSTAGRYTKRMEKELVVGKTLWLKLPYGEFFQVPHKKDKCVFIAGGTGITPYLSLFQDLSFTEYSKPVLYFGARSAEYNIYSEDLQKSSEINSSFECRYVYENIDGMLNIEKIFVENGREATYFISGPPALISNFKKYLLDLAVPKSNIRTDEWE
ncbi:MAG: propane monooxygenase reductase component [Bacteroidota bacterium]|nr:propane monooxygenase reductase component [Bacteroidota bacterium]